MHTAKGYLTEEKLGNVLSSVYAGCTIIHNKAYTGQKFRPDYHIVEERIVVEFDGYQHYTSSKNIIRDDRKDLILLNDNIRVIRVPYFVQLSTEVIKELFGTEYTHIQTYPHGFVDKTAVLPADYCELGIDRFIKDLDRFGYVRDEILNSLKNKIEIEHHDHRTIITAKLRNNFPNYFKSID